MNYDLIINLLYELCFYNKFIADILNKEIVYNRLKFVFIIVITSLFISLVFL